MSPRDDEADNSRNPSTLTPFTSLKGSYSNEERKKKQISCVHARKRATKRKKQKHSQIFALREMNLLKPRMEKLIFTPEKKITNIAKAHKSSNSSQ